MMNKLNVIGGLKALIRAGEVTKKELLDIYDEETKDGSQSRAEKQSKISNILYFIGGMIVFLGICIFVGSNWNHLNDVTKILATLGSSVAMFMAATLLGRYGNLEKVSDAFYFIASLIAPVGTFITLDIAGMDTGTAGVHTLIAAILFAVQVSFYMFEKRNVFVVFQVIFGSWLFFALTTTLMGGRPFADWDFIKYRWLIAGLSHAVLGYALVNTSKSGLTPWLYSGGIISFLTSALCLGGYSPDQNIFWELIFPGLVFGVLFLSVYLKARSFLIFGTTFLMFYIIKITNEYFTSGFGWALSLIVIGFLLMGTGYFAFYINNKYIKEGQV